MNKFCACFNFPKILTNKCFTTNSTPSPKTVVRIFDWSWTISHVPLRWWGGGKKFHIVPKRTIVQSDMVGGSFTMFDKEGLPKEVLKYNLSTIEAFFNNCGIFMFITFVTCQVTFNCKGDFTNIAF